MHIEIKLRGYPLTAKIHRLLFRTNVERKNLQSQYHRSNDLIIRRLLRNLRSRWDATMGENGIFVRPVSPYSDGIQEASRLIQHENNLDREAFVLSI